MLLLFTQQTKGEVSNKRTLQFKFTTVTKVSVNNFQGDGDWQFEKVLEGKMSVWQKNILPESEQRDRSMFYLVLQRCG